MKIALILTFGAFACSEPKSVEQRKQNAEDAYGAELKACVDTSETRARANACGDRVRQAWKQDGGIR